MNPPVPWNAAWTGESDRFEIRSCRYVHGKLAVWQPNNPGAGKPMFAEPHIVRQRRSIAEMRCTVCGEKTPASDRWWFEHGQRHAGMYITTEAPVHHVCAEHSLSVCPHLRKLGLSPSRFPEGASVLAATIRPESLLNLFGLNSRTEIIGQLKLGWPLSRIRVLKGED